MLEQSVIISLLILAIWFTMQEEQIFGRLGLFLEKYLPEQIHKPVFGCPVCMTPWYGTVLYWMIPWGRTGITFYADPWQWVITVITAMGINVLITKLWPE
jgi:hypothetical protein